MNATYNRAQTHAGVCRDCTEWVCDGNCPHGLINLARKKEMTRWEKQLGEELSQPAGTILGRKRKKKKAALKLLAPTTRKENP